MPTPNKGVVKSMRTWLRTSDDHRTFGVVVTRGNGRKGQGIARSHHSNCWEGPDRVELAREWFKYFKCSFPIIHELFAEAKVASEYRVMFPRTVV